MHFINTQIKLSMELVRGHGEFYTGGGLKNFFQIIKFKRHQKIFFLFCTQYLKLYILLIMWKILNNVSSAAASLNKYQSQTKSSLIKRK